MLLFICYVSEDKEDFVAPLAAELRGEYEVWYDDYELTLGDSLPEKIDDGLKRCGFGIVVLSKAFFAKKKWARKELDGLFALEAKRGKIILPVWKGVTSDDVAEYSPMLASKIAVSDSEGLPKVIEKIRLAVALSERKRELTALDVAAKRARALEQTLAEKQRSEQLLRSEPGATLVSQGVQKVYETIENVLSGVGESSTVLRFEFGKPMLNILYIRTVYGMQMGLGVTQLASNSARNARLEVKIFRQQFDRFREPTSELTVFHETEFKPAFRAGDELAWIATDNKSYQTEELVGHLVDLFMEHVEREIESRTE